MGTRYGTFCPIAKATEVLGGRWTFLILSELTAGAARFSDIQQGVPLMPRSLLARRLKEMEQNGLVQREPQPNGRGHLYRLTESGNGLRPMLDMLMSWGEQWRMPLVDKRDRNVSFIMWQVRRRLMAAGAGNANAVIGFEFSNLPRRDHKLRHWWLVLRDGNVDLCITALGFEPELKIRADLEVFTRIVTGYDSMAESRRNGGIEFDGDAGLVAQFIGWLGISEPPVVRFPVFSRSKKHASAQQEGSGYCEVEFLEEPEIEPLPTPVPLATAGRKRRAA